MLSWTKRIIALLKDARAGVSVQDLCRKHGISNATFSKWRTKYAGLEVSDVKKLHQLEEENLRLKQMVAKQAPDLPALKGVTCDELKIESMQTKQAFDPLTWNIPTCSSEARSLERH